MSGSIIKPDWRTILKLRIAELCDHAGPWGKFVQSIIAGGYAYASFTHYQSFLDVMRLDDIVGATGMGWWFTCMAILPMLAYLADVMWMRVVVTFLLILSWSMVFLSGIEEPPYLQPFRWISFACILIALNAERLLAREAMEGFVARHPSK